MDTMPRLVDSGTALQLLDKGGIIGTLVYDGGNADMGMDWTLDQRKGREPGAHSIRGDGCSVVTPTRRRNGR